MAISNAFIYADRATLTFRCKMAQIVYITSSSHSGSTVLDLLVGSINGVFSTGELAHLTWLLRHQQNPSDDTHTVCSCRRGLRDCPAWGKILRRVGRRLGFDVFDKPKRLRLQLLHNERYSKWGRFKSKFKPRGTFGHIIQHSKYAPLEELVMRLYRSKIRSNWNLFDEIGRTLGVRYVVDSSKVLQRLKMLYWQRPDDVTVLCLMRGLRGKAYSSKMRGRDMYASARAWVRHYNRTWRVLRRMNTDRILPVQYERASADPAAARRRIAQFLNLEDPGDQIDIDTRNYHLIGGNTVRYDGPIEIRTNVDWRDDLTDQELSELHKIAQDLDPGLLKLGLKPFAETAE